MSMVTAKVKCSAKGDVYGEGDNRQVQVSFQPDYADGRNAAWAVATPNLSFSMTLRGSVADEFEAGAAYTLQIVRDDPAAV